VCFPDSGNAWRDRFDVGCETIWPSPRAGHAAALDKKRRGMWLYGGYTTYYPYLTTGQAGGLACCDHHHRHYHHHHHHDPHHPFPPPHHHPHTSFVTATGGVGAGTGTKTATVGEVADFAPYPTHPFYLEDLWFYNFTSGLWRQVR
jgi:hypothetical protein